MANVKRNIYRVLPIIEKHTLIGWKVTGPGGYTSSLMHADGNYKRHAITLAVSLAKENQRSQIFVFRKSRKTGKYRIKLEWSYGVDSKAEG